MFGFLTDLFSGIVQFLTGALPRSPFSDLTLSEDVHTMLGWLNWLVPFDLIVGLVTGVVAVFAIAKVAMWVISNGVDLGKLATGGK